MSSDTGTIIIRGEHILAALDRAYQTIQLFYAEIPSDPPSYRIEAGGRTLRQQHDHNAVNRQLEAVAEHVSHYVDEVLLGDLRMQDDMPMTAFLDRWCDAEDRTDAIGGRPFDPADDARPLNIPAEVLDDMPNMATHEVLDYITETIQLRRELGRVEQDDEAALAAKICRAILALLPGEVRSCVLEDGSEPYAELPRTHRYKEEDRSIGGSISMGGKGIPEDWHKGLQGDRYNQRGAAE